MEMEPLKALDLLFIAAGKAMLVKDDHVFCEKAYKLLKEQLSAPKEQPVEQK